MFLKNQGGLLDIELHPNFSVNNKIFFSFSKGDNDTGANTAVASATLINNSLENIEAAYTMVKNKLHHLYIGDAGYNLITMVIYSLQLETEEIEIKILRISH